jgi:hypothetical protein
VKTDIDKFRDSVELMSSDEITTQIEERMKTVNAHVLAAENERKHVAVLYEEKTKRMRL